jgi:aconitate decarboxylase
MTHLTQELAQFIHHLKPQDLPEIATTTVRRGISDCMGVLFAGRNEPVVGHALSIINLSSGPRTARVLGDRGSASSSDAAFINAVAAHALDYDDTGLDGHPSVVLAPVVLAEAQALGKDWQSAVTAYVAGYECWAELIGRDPEKHHGKGWHPTAVFGVIACAAASAHLRQLNLQQTAHALGIAASLASGVVANFGSMTKPLQVGWAARNGILACQLAERGLTSSADALESPRGFLAAVSPRGQADLERPCTAGHPWQILQQGLNIKRYPVCYAVHRLIDACLSLRARETVVAEQIDHMDVHIGHHQAAMLRSHAPKTELDAKFSAEFAVACALSSGHVNLDDLNETNITQPQLQSWMQLVRIRPTDVQDPDDPLFSPYDQLTIHLRNGGQLISDTVSKAQGHALRPIDEAQLKEKFFDCAQRSLSPAQAALWWLSCNASGDEPVHWP